MLEPLNVKIFTLFPESFPGTLGISVTGNALKNNIWNLQTINIRDYAENKHGTVDDTPYGGGAGMVMKPDIIAKAIDDNITNKKNFKFICPSPRGKVFNQQKAKELSTYKNIAVVCGRFEGIDQRVIDDYEMEEISLGDFVLSGGEMAAIVMLDSCIRLLPGTLGDKDSLSEESFGSAQEFSSYKNLLEYPHYTKPAEWRGKSVPEILLSGNHKEIEKWRLKKAEELTKERRNDLWEKYLTSKKLNK